MSNTNKKSYIIIALVLVIVGGYIIYQQWSPGLGGEKCGPGEIGLTKCVDKKEVVYKCVPDPLGCSQRVRDGSPCERGGCVLQPAPNCRVAEGENYLLRCVPAIATEEGESRSTNTIEYQDKRYVRTDSTSSIPAISEDYKIMELEGGEIVYAPEESVLEEQLFSLKPENAKNGQNTYIIWQEEERFQYSEDVARIEKMILAANSCAVDNDCIAVNFGCPFDCLSFVNKDEVERIERKIEKLDKYGFQCEWDCPASFVTAKCVNNACQ